MNALLSFKRTAKSDASARGASTTSDPLMDSKVMLDEIPEEHFSTLKFLDIKREEEAKREAQATPVSTPAATALPQASQAQTSQAQASQAYASKSAGKPSRMQLFKDRVVIEQQDRIALPFAASGKAAVQAAQINLANLKHTAGQPSAIRALLNNSLTNSAASVVSTTAENGTTTSNAANNTPSADTISSEHLRLATHASFCLTRSHENLQTVLQRYLADSDNNKPLHLILADADEFDFCAGAGDLFIKSTRPAVHRLTETEQLRTLAVATTARIAIDSLTAAHPLRARGMDEQVFANWFTEEGQTCDTGVSPIETFVQAELLHMQQQVQRTLVQLRRLAAHLQAHCLHLQPLEALHHTGQADAWVQQYGQAAPASLYRLLECAISNAADTAKPAAASTVYEYFIEHPAKLPAFNAIAWPHIPAGLQLLQTLAQLAGGSKETATDTDSSQTLLERLAVLDVLMRAPQNTGAGVSAATPNATDAAHVRILLTAENSETLLTEIADRFATLASQLNNAGLLPATPHPEGKADNAGKYA